jgi:hypothetical protein
MLWIKIVLASLVILLAVGMLAEKTFSFKALLGGTSLLFGLLLIAAVMVTGG